jgi:AcrR family transcriptional regulator
VTATLETSSKRDRILTAARALFAERRFDEVSVPEIVKLAGVAQGTFYRYFTSKNALVDGLTMELGQAVVGKIKPIFETNRPFVKQLEPILRTALETTSQFQDVLGFLNTDALLFAETPEGETQRAPLIEMIVRKLERDQALGAIDKSIDCQVVARLVDSVLNRMAKDCLLGQSQIDTERYLQQTVAFLKRALEPI